MSEGLLNNQVVKGYTDAIEKQVSQLSDIVHTLERMDERLDTIEAAFLNGFKQDLLTGNKDVIKSVDSIKNNTDNELLKFKTVISDLSRSINNELMGHIEKIISAHTEKLSSTMKFERAISIIGWVTLIGVLVAKIFIK